MIFCFSDFQRKILKNSRTYSDYEPSSLPEKNRTFTINETGLRDGFNKCLKERSRSCSPYGPESKDYSRPESKEYSRPESKDYARSKSKEYSRPGTREYSRPGSREYSRPGSRDYSCPKSGSGSRNICPTEAVEDLHKLGETPEPCSGDDPKLCWNENNNNINPFNNYSKVFI